jgi:FlaA1/EpsC-like NDP-sugar epimerase
MTGKPMVTDKSILIRHTDIKRLVVYSRDELKQFEMSQQFPGNRYTDLCYFIAMFAIRTTRAVRWKASMW